eukprot:6299156-Amphidinium_carterae.1
MPNGRITESIATDVCQALCDINELVTRCPFGWYQPIDGFTDNFYHASCSWYVWHSPSFQPNGLYAPERVAPPPLPHSRPIDQALINKASYDAPSKNLPTRVRWTGLRLAVH